MVMMMMNETFRIVVQINAIRRNDGTKCTFSLFKKSWFLEVSITSISLVVIFTISSVI
jgi:hypothetical protein